MIFVKILEEEVKKWTAMAIFLVKTYISLELILDSADEEKMNIIDHTETNLVALRRTIYLTIQSRYAFVITDNIPKSPGIHKKY